MSENLKEWIKDIAAAIVIATIILQFIKPTLVIGSSMENTLHEHDYLFASRKAYTLFGEPQYNDIVVFHSNLTKANGKEKLLVKRIIGLPGDTISISDGNVYRNGEMLVENYTKEGYTEGFMEEITVPEGRLFVMGDNRQNSADSRLDSVGCIAVDEILGKAVFRLYPFNKIGKL